MKRRDRADSGTQVIDPVGCRSPPNGVIARPLVDVFAYLASAENEREWAQCSTSPPSAAKAWGRDTAPCPRPRRPARGGRHRRHRTRPGPRGCQDIGEERAYQIPAARFVADGGLGKAIAVFAGLKLWCLSGTSDVRLTTPFSGTRVFARPARPSALAMLSLSLRRGGVRAPLQRRRGAAGPGCRSR